MASLLTDAQLARVHELVRLHHASLMVELLGDNSVAPSVLKALKARGLYRKPKGRDPIRKAYDFGRIGLINPKVLQYGEKKFEHYLATKGEDLRPVDREVLQVLRKSFRDYMDALADDAKARVTEEISKADKSLQRRLAQRVRREAYLELERRKALAEVAKGLTDTLPVLHRNAVRIASTETNNAFQDGRAQEILRSYPGKDPVVFKRPRNDACEDCVKAYLERDGKTPRLFKLSELVANGTNIGKSRADRQPVLESFHPYCACVLNVLPSGFGFNSQGEMVFQG